MKTIKLLWVAILALAAGIDGMAQTQPNVENGFKPYGSYDGSNLDTVNMLNSNVMLHVSLYPDIPQRGGKLGPKEMLYSSGANWVKGCSGSGSANTCYWTLLGGGVAFQQMWGTTVNRSLNVDSTSGQTTYSAVVTSIVTADGATHHVFVIPGSTNAQGVPTAFESVDGTGLHLVLSNVDPQTGLLTTAVVTDRQGTQYVSTFNGGQCSNHPSSPFIGASGYSGMIDNFPVDAGITCTQRSALSQISDSNGNTVIFPPFNSGTAGTDTLGRPAEPWGLATETQSDSSGCNNGAPFWQAWFLSYFAPNGVNNPLKLCYSTISFATGFYLAGVAENQGSTNLLTTVINADGETWNFTYENSYLSLTSLTLPTGGSISYDWTNFDPSGLGWYERVLKTRTLNDNNGHSFQWKYQWGTLQGTSVGSTLTNVVTDPQGNDSVHIFRDVVPGSDGFFETSTISYQGPQASGQLLQRVDTVYGTATTIAGHAANVFPTSIQTTIYPSGKVRLVTKQYDSGLGSNAPIFGNVVVEKDYDWGQGAPGPLLRETDTTYAWQGNSAYLTAHLLDLPASVIVKDGSGCALSETDYTYDEAQYLTAGNITTDHGASPAGVRGNLTTVTKWLAPAGSCNPKGGTAITSHTNWYDTGEVYQQIDPLGRTTTHYYDPAYQGGYATQTCSPSTSGGTIAHCVSGTYDYNTGLLTSFSNENATTQASGNTPGDSAHTTSYAYDQMSRMTSATFPPDPSNGNHQAQTTFAYAAPNVFPFTVTRTKTITPTLSDSATTIFDGLGRATRTQHVTPGGTATVDTVYDGLDHVVSVSNPYFSTSDATYGIIQTQYDALGRATQVTDQDGSIKKVAYNVAPIQAAPGDCTESTDEAGTARMACSDGLGRLIEVHEPGDNFNGSAASGSISISGTMKSQSGVGAVGATTAQAQVTISGNEQSKIIHSTPPSTSYDTGKVYITINGHEYDYQFGTTDTPDTANSVAEGLVTAIQSDSARVVNASVPLNGTVITLTAVNSGSAGNAITVSTGYTWVSRVFPSPSFTTSPASENLSGGSDANPGVTVYDQGTVSVSMGSGFTASAPYSQSGNNTAALIASALVNDPNSGLNRGGSPVHASLSGPTTIQITDGSVGTAGNVAVAVGAASTQTQWTFSPPSFGGSGTTLSGGYNPEGPSLDFNYFVTQYAYDGLGNLLQVTQQGDPTVSGSSQWRVRNFTYDSFSRLLTATNPESGTISYSYDAVGNLLQKTSPAPNQTGTATQPVSYCYDELNRVTQRDYSAHTYSPPACPITAPVVSYVYDQGANAIGHLTSLTDQAGSASYTYDILSRLSRESRTINGVTKNMGYGYQLGGSLKTLTYPSGATVTYTPDSAGRDLSAVDGGSGINYATSATYDATSALTGFVSGASGGFSGIANSFSFNPRLQPVSMSASIPSQTVFSIGYDFHSGNGDNGNVFGITNGKDSTRNQTFSYDALNRLISAQNAGTDCSQKTLNPNETKFWGNSYGYDAWGNLLSKSATKCSAEPLSVTALANNQLLGYSYDAAGNMTHDSTSGLNYGYDQENRITGAAGFTYTYDGDGNRVEKSNGSTGMLYWYTTPGIVAESDLSGNLQSEYVIFDGERIARKDFPSNAVSYYFSDHLKTASVITDSAGNIKAESDYYPWGGELPFLANDSNHYKFTGKERDSETGLDYFGARYYSNGLGRWISADWSTAPIPVPYADFSDPQSLNLYGYVRNLPTTRIDTDGHDLLGDLVGVMPVTGPLAIVGVKNALDKVSDALANFASTFLQLEPHAGPLPPPSSCTCPETQSNRNDSKQNDSEQNQNSSQQSSVKNQSAQSKQGTIYRVPKSGTKSGKPYIGRHNKPNPAKTRRSPDGRDRTKAEVVDKYDADNTMEGRTKEQEHIDKSGLENLDNKRNEIRKPKKED